MTSPVTSSSGRIMRAFQGAAELRVGAAQVKLADGLRRLAESPVVALMRIAGVMAAARADHAPAADDTAAEHVRAAVGSIARRVRIGCHPDDFADDECVAAVRCKHAGQIA